MSTRFLTIADVAEQLQLSAQAVRALIRTGDLPAIQVGARKLWRIEDQALEDYIQRQLASTRPWSARAGTRPGRPEPLGPFAALRAGAAPRSPRA